MKKRHIWIIDTSVFLNILDVPGFNQHRQSIISLFEVRIKNGDTFFLPFATLLETGNHIAHLNGNIKFTKAKEYVIQVRLALENKAPYKPLKFPDKKDLLKWIDGFPEKAGEGIGFGDFSIIKDWEEQVKMSRGWLVGIWSLDHHLQGFQSNKD